MFAREKQLVTCSVVFSLASVFTPYKILAMLKNYWVIAYRNFGRNKAFSLINILSLELRISAALLIFLVVDYVCTFDKFQKDRGQIYRVVTNSIASGRTFTNSGVVAPMGDALRKEMAGLDAVIPFRTWSEGAKLTIPAASGVSPPL